MLKGSWQELYSEIIYNAADLQIKYDSRISKPEVIEYTNSTLRFDFTNLHAMHNGWDSYAYIFLDHNTKAGLSSSYRRGHFENVMLKSVDQWTGSATFNPHTITIRIPENKKYNLAASILGDGTPLSGSVDQIYDNLVNPNHLHEYKLRQDNRITSPLLIEFGSNSTHPIYFDYHSLAGFHNSWDSYGISYVHKNNPTGLSSSYRRGHANYVSLPGRDQHNAHAVIPREIDFLIW